MPESGTVCFVSGVENAPKRKIMGKSIRLLVILLVPCLVLAGTFIEKTEPIDEDFLKGVKPLNTGVSFSTSCGFFQEQERLCVFYEGDQIGPPGFLFRVKPTKELVRLCEFFGLSTYYYQDACDNPWETIREYHGGDLSKNEFIAEYRKFVHCLDKVLDAYKGLNCPAEVDPLKKKYVGQLADAKYYNLCLLNFIRTGNYSFIYKKSKKRFAKSGPDKFEKVMVILKSQNKSHPEKIYAFHPKFFVEFVNRHGAKVDSAFEKSLKRQGVVFWD